MVACAADVRRRILEQKGKQKAKINSARAAVEEDESDEEMGNAEGGGKKFVWDASKGMLVEEAAKPDGEGEVDGKPGASQQPSTLAEEGAAEGVAAKDSSAPAAPDSAEQETAEGASSSGEEESSEDDVEAASKEAFLNDASTPELIKQAISVGGPMADGVRNKWVLDRATQLYFRYDSAARQMHCWNPGQGCMYLWRQRGKMDFLWASPSGPSATPPPGPAPAAAASAAPGDAVPSAPPQEKTPTSGDAASGAAAAPAGRGPGQVVRLTLQVIVIPPEVLVAGGIGIGAKIVEEMEFSKKALAGVIGRGGASIKEIEKMSGIKASQLEPAEGETVGRLRLEGTKAQLAEAKGMLEQKVVLAIGEKAAEKMHKHISSRLLEKKRNETGSDAAKGGVQGLSDFCVQWGVKAVMARKLAKLDAQFQRYMIRHFKPKKAKPVNALRGYTVALLKPPQRWRLEALYEDGELDGEICETFPVGEFGAVVGRGGTEGAEGSQPGEEFADQQRIDLEVDSQYGEQASRVFGDVQPQHCKLMRMGSDFYAWALEAQIGTVVDGQKYRQHDGPVAVRDGSIIGVGKYLLYCEVGSADALQLRRKRMLAGERLWKASAAADPGAPGASGEAADAAAGTGAGAAEEAGKAAAKDDAEAEDGDASQEAEPRDEAMGAAAVSASASASAAVKRKRPAEDEAAAAAATTEEAQQPPAKRSSNSAAAAIAAYEAASAAAESSSAQPAPPKKLSGAAAAAAAYEATLAAESRPAQSSPPKKLSSAAAAAAAYEATLAAGELSSAQSAPPKKLSGAAAAAAAYEAAAAAAESSTEKPAAPKKLSSAAAAAAAFEAEAAAADDASVASVGSGKSRAQSATAAPGAAADAEEESDDEVEEEPDPMQEMMRQLGLPCGFG